MGTLLVACFIGVLGLGVLVYRIGYWRGAKDGVKRATNLMHNAFLELPDVPIPKIKDDRVPCCNTF